MADNNLPPDDDEMPNPHHQDPSGEFDPNKSDDVGVPVRNIRVVDGVSSSDTYAVLATNGEHRLAVRWLHFRETNERNRNGSLKEDGHKTLSACFKVHIEKDHRKRVEISERSFTKFGLPDVFWYKHDRFTGVIEIPFCYLPSNEVKMKVGFDNANLPALLWAIVCDPCIQNGGEIDGDKRRFAKWVYAQIGTPNFEHFEDLSEKAIRGYPIIRAFWESLSHLMDDTPNVQFDESQFGPSSFKDDANDSDFDIDDND